MSNFDLINLNLTHEEQAAIYLFCDQNGFDVRRIFNLHQDLLQVNIVDAEHVEKNEPDGQNFYIPPIPGEIECPQCFCKPCITDEKYRQLWWSTEFEEPKETILSEDI